MPAGHHRYLRSFRYALVAAALALLAVLIPARHAGAVGCEADASIDAEEQHLLDLVNAYREERDLPALTLSNALSRSAAWKAEHLGTEAYFAHDDVPIGRSWTQRIRDCGYGENAWLGENLAAGTKTAEQTLAWWQASPGHDANLLGEHYLTAGIGRAYVEGSPYAWYWVIELASVVEPPPEPCYDLTGDGRVRVRDVALVVEGFRTGDPRADVTGDGRVRVDDVAAVTRQFGRDCAG